jgi:hypothetical protein
VLQTEASCPSGALLTVDVDGAIVATRPTELRCEIDYADGQSVVDERSLRSSAGTVCR